MVEVHSALHRWWRCWRCTHPHLEPDAPGLEVGLQAGLGVPAEVGHVQTVVRDLEHLVVEVVMVVMVVVMEVMMVVTRWIQGYRVGWPGGEVEVTKKKFK